MTAASWQHGSEGNEAELWGGFPEQTSGRLESHICGAEVREWPGYERQN